MVDGVEVLAWVLCNVSDRIESTAKLRYDDCIKDARDPFILPHYRISPVIVKMSKLVKVKG
jgi:hypothetical protein